MIHLSPKIPTHFRNPTSLNITALNEKLNSIDTTDWLDLNRAIYSEDPKTQLFGVVGIKKLLLTNSDQISIGMIVDSGLVPALLGFLNWEDNPDLQFEAAWCLVTLATLSPEHLRVVVEASGIPGLVKICYVGDQVLSNHAIIALGTIANTSMNYRDLVIQAEAVDAFIFNLNNQKSLNYASDVIWAMGRLCQGVPYSKDLFKTIGRFVYDFIVTVEKSGFEIDLKDPLWTLATIGRSFSLLEILAFITPGIIEFLLEFLDKNTKNEPYFEPAIEILGEISAFEPVTEFLKVKNCVQLIESIIRNVGDNIHKSDLIWFVSNLATGSSEQLQYFIDSPKILNDLVNFALFDAYKHVQVEAFKTLAKMTLVADCKQIEVLFDSQVIEVINKFLGSDEDELVLIALNAISMFLACDLNSGEDKPKYKTWIIEKEVLKSIEHLLDHPNEEVYNATVKILETYFDQDDTI